MSTNQECEFVERAPGEWFYLLEFDTDNFDWRENAYCHGPFATEEAARAHLHQNYANPGGSWLTPHDAFKMTPQYERAFARALAEEPVRSYWPIFVR